MYTEADIERAAEAVYKVNMWWRLVLPDDDGKGVYRNGHGADRFRRVEWSELSEDEKEDIRKEARAALSVLPGREGAVLEQLFDACTAINEAFRDVPMKVPVSKLKSLEQATEKMRIAYAAARLSLSKPPAAEG